MLNVEFWYMYFGVHASIVGLLGLFQPKELKRTLKGISRRVSTLRMLGVFAVFMSTLVWYTASTAEQEVSSMVLLVLSYVMLVKALVLIYLARWYRKSLVKRVLKLKEMAFRLIGLAAFAIGVASLVYAIVYL